MSSILNFLDTSLSIDQGEGTAQENYQYQKETLGEMYSEQKEQLKDSAMQALPFGVAEASRAIQGAWETKNRIFAFKEKYSPQIEAFKAKASEMFDNIGKEGGQAIDYTELLKTGATKLGRQALELATPEVLKRTGIDLSKALNASKGEGGIEAGLNNLKEQGIDIATNKITRVVDDATERVKGVIEPVLASVNREIAPIRDFPLASLRTGRTAEDVGAVGAGVERAINPSVRATTSAVETTNPLFEGALEEGLTRYSNVASDLSARGTDAVKAVASRTSAVIDTYRAGSAQLQGKFSEAQGKLVEAQSRVAELQGKAPALEPTRSMYPAERGNRPLVTQKTNPALEQAKADVETHTSTINEIRAQGAELRETTQTAFDTAREGLNVAKNLAGGVLSVGGDALGIFGAVQSGQDLARGNVTTQGAVGDTIGLYFGAKSGGGIIGSVQAKISSSLDKAKQVVTSETNKVLGFEGKPQISAEPEISAGSKPVSVENKPSISEGGRVEVNPEAVIKSAELPVGNVAEEEIATNFAKTGAEQIGKTLGIGLAEEGAEIGAVAVSSSAIPIVGEAIDIGLGLYTAVTAIMDLFKSPPKPPPPPQPQQQVVAVQHQQGVF